MSIADSASDQIEHDLALAELSAEQDALYEIDEALRRIRNGTYGVCELTGEPIALARLRAVPWTRFASEVEARLETTGQIRLPHLGMVGSVREGPQGVLDESEEETEPPIAGDESMQRFSVPTGTSASAEPRHLRKSKAGRSHGS